MKNTNKRPLDKKGSKKQWLKNYFDIFTGSQIKSEKISGRRQVGMVTSQESQHTKLVLVPKQW